MTSPGQNEGWIFSLPTAIAALVLATAFMIVIATQPMQAQTFTVLHNFTGGLDGAEPYAGLTMDRGRKPVMAQRSAVAAATVPFSK